MRRAALPAAALLAAACASAPRRAAEPAFVPVFIDAASEAELGPFPYDRAMYAAALERLDAAGARGVVVKLFLDRPGSAQGDARLAAAMRRLPTLLQFRFDDSEPSPAPLPASFELQGASVPAEALGGGAGWLPVEPFASAARGGGFVDFDPESGWGRVPVVGSYRGRPVPSLWLASLGLLPGGAARLEGGALVRGERRLPVDAKGEVEAPWPGGEVRWRSFADLVGDRLDPALFKDKVVVLGYVGEKAASFEAPGGPLSAHAAFVQFLRALDLATR